MARTSNNGSHNNLISLRFVRGRTPTTLGRIGAGCIALPVGLALIITIVIDWLMGDG